MINPLQQPYDDIFIGKITLVGVPDVNGYIGHGFVEQRLDPFYGVDASHTTFYVDLEGGRQSTLTSGGSIMNPAIELNKQTLSVGTLVPIRIIGHFAVYGDVYQILAPRAVLDVTCIGGTLIVTRM